MSFTLPTARPRQCSAACGSGLQTRDVFCGALDELRRVAAVEDSNCDPVKRYGAARACEGATQEPCPAAWRTSPWGPVSVGNGLFAHDGSGLKHRYLFYVLNDELELSLFCVFIPRYLLLLARAPLGGGGTLNVPPGFSQ